MLNRSPAPFSSVSRRDFLKVCSLAAAAVGLPASAAEKMAASGPAEEALGHLAPLPGVHRLHRVAAPHQPPRTRRELILDLISLDYHETLMAAAGHQVEAALDEAVKENDGKFVLVVEGAIPVKDDGIYCRIGDRTALDIAEGRGRPRRAPSSPSAPAPPGAASRRPRPTRPAPRASGDVLKGKTVVTIPGCPANPYNLLGMVLQYATFGTLPELDDKGRPKFAYSRVIHDDCPRRAHFDDGRFAQRYGDEGPRQGWCLYKIGCKGPQTHANCSLLHFGEVVGAWPIGIGAQCFGCTEKELGLPRSPVPDRGAGAARRPRACTPR